MDRSSITRNRTVLSAVLAGLLLMGSGSVPAAAETRAASFHARLQADYAQLKVPPTAYRADEIDRYGDAAIELSGEDRLYALWRVLYAYKDVQNGTQLQAWCDRISRRAHQDNDSDLDLMARFMAQAYNNEAHGYKVLTDRDWQTYLSAGSPAVRNAVAIERVRLFLHFSEYADAIDMGNSLIDGLQREGPRAGAQLSAAHQVMAKAVGGVGDQDAYTDHMDVVAHLSQQNAFMPQRLETIYDLAWWATRQNDIELAEQFQKLHASYVKTYGLKDAKPFGDYLCARIESVASKYAEVIECLRDVPLLDRQARNPREAMELKYMARAYAEIGDVAKAREYLAQLQAVPVAVMPRDLFAEKRIEAQILRAQGQTPQAFDALNAWSQSLINHDEEVRNAAVSSMYKALRKELDRKNAEAKALAEKARADRWLAVTTSVIALLLAALAAGSFFYVLRMRRLQWELKDANEHAEAANAAKSRFLAVMSHELRTPLNGILGMAQALKKENLNETQAGHVDILVESGHTLMVLLNDVLDMSRIEAGKVELAPTPASMKDMLERVINTYKPMIDDKDLNVRYRLDDSASPIMSFDVLRVYQCLSNLLSNAIKFTDKGSVRINASAEKLEDGGYMVSVEVRDTGIGMSKPTMDRLFEAYAQADAGTARKYGGTGLGLNISRRLTQLMGGNLSVTSEEGLGSSFIMTFRAGEVAARTPQAIIDLAEDAIADDLVVEAPAAVPAPQPAPQPVVTPLEAAETAGERPYKILLVDDHPVNRKVARLFLEPFGFQITEAVDGQEALDADMSQYDLVLMDLNMPRLGGLEATRIFRANEAPGKHVPIVALTADAMQDQIDACHVAGMDAHISKPILMDKLIDTVSRLMGLDGPEDEKASAIQAV
jgi:signal transduction histidine kinase